jgi:hypothetical protein
MRKPALVSLVLFPVSVTLVLAGWAAGALSLSGVEPRGLSYVGCGPAVFGRPSPLPHPACTDAYFPLPFVCWSLIGLGIMSAIIAIVLPAITAAAIRRGRPKAVSDRHTLRTAKGTSG